tara:strand:- start:13010 stop:13426 length:417 start_codon:yes stop_codon:yes gene_type:complete
MKIHVIKMEQEAIEGYKKVLVSDNYINFMDISDNECTEILANDVLDSFYLSNIRDCIVSLVSKLRLGGKLIIGGKDLRLFCKSVINGAIEEADGAQLIQSINSMSSLNEIKPFIESLGLKVLNTQLAGIHFEIVAQRA